MMFREPLIERHRKVIDPENCRISEVFELLIALCTLFLIALSMFQHQYGVMNAIYIIFFVVSTLSYFVIRFYIRKHLNHVGAAIIAVLMQAYLYSLCSGIFFNLHAPSITVYALMVAACSAYLIPYSLTALIHCVCGTVYISFALALKPEYGMQDAINYIIFLAMSLILTWFIYGSRLKYLQSVDDARKKEQDNERLLNNIPCGVGIFDVVDEKVNHRYINDAYYRLIHETRQERDERNHGQFINGIAPENRNLVCDAVKTIAAGEDHVDFSYKAILKDNSTMWLRLEGNVVSREENHIVLYCSFSNVTQMYQQLEDELRNTSAALETAKKANEAKTDFYSRMSHDMRTPMNGILGMTALSKDENDLERLHYNLDMIEASGTYMLSLINDSLDMHRIETGKLSLSPSIFYAKTFVESIQAMVRPTAQQKGIQFEIHNLNVNVDCYCKADPVRFKQIFMNLVSNAIKFTPEGGTVEVEMECTKHTKYRDWDVFRVRDTGVGMSQEYIDNGLFSAYEQEENEMTSQYAGSGLGLAISKSLIDLMGGTIEVESELGKGTTFIVSFSIELVDKKEVEASALAGDTKENKSVAILENRRVLLCEDHPLNAEIAICLLNQKGILVEHAENGEVGLSMFANSTEGYYDAVLMDIRMPIMNGLETAKAIRHLKRYDVKHIPIIAMTANAYAEDVQNTKDAGMDAHLSKPIEPDKMFETLSVMIQKALEAEHERILVVDDVEMNREVIKANLYPEYDVYEASDGVEALELLNKDKYDLVITDIQMPNMNGVELIQQIRSQERFRDLLIIANTQLGEPNQEEELIALGANDFVFKPNSPKVLRLRVQNLLR